MRKWWERMGKRREKVGKDEEMCDGRRKWMWKREGKEREKYKESREWMGKGERV